jgi:hypothetical protein
MAPMALPNGSIDVIVSPKNQEAARPYLQGLRHGSNVISAIWKPKPPSA